MENTNQEPTMEKPDPEQMGMAPAIIEQFMDAVHASIGARTTVLISCRDDGGMSYFFRGDDVTHALGTLRMGEHHILKNTRMVARTQEEADARARGEERPGDVEGAAEGAGSAEPSEGGAG